MNRHVTAKPEVKNAPPIVGGLLQRKCACGQHTGAGECEACRKKKPSLQRKEGKGAESVGVPPIVHDVLRSPGQPLESTTRQLMESRFNHDFSGVRVHADEKAAESARAVGAEAYTVGWDIAFATSQSEAQSQAWERLLAHELTHVVQQTSGGSLSFLSSEEAEHEAEQTAAAIAAGSERQVLGRDVHGALRREEAKKDQKTDENPLDEKAKKIIAAVTDSTKSYEQRAKDAITLIVDAYYDPSLVKEVRYDEKDPGLSTTYEGEGKNLKGIVTVGKYFIDTFGSFYARKVLQVGHELEHVRQQQGGMSGPGKKHEREFLAFHWEALAPEKSGTGRMPHASRRALIDAALGNYYCLSEDDQKRYAEKKKELLARREIENKSGGNESTEPPTTCKGK